MGSPRPGFLRARHHFVAGQIVSPHRVASRMPSSSPTNTKAPGRSSEPLGWRPAPQQGRCRGEPCRCRAGAALIANNPSATVSSPSNLGRQARVRQRGQLRQSTIRGSATRRGAWSPVLATF